MGRVWLFLLAFGARPPCAGAQHVQITNRPPGRTAVRMAGADAFVRGANDRHLYVDLPVDVHAWAHGYELDWLSKALGDGANRSWAAAHSSVLHTRTAGPKTGARVQPNGFSLHGGPSEGGVGGGVTVEKPSGRREVHVRADGIVLDGVNLTLACAAFDADGRVSHAAVDRATVHSPRKCASPKRNEDVALSIAGPGEWSHILFEDLAQPSEAVLLSRPGEACVLRTNAPFFLEDKNLTDCMAAVVATMQSPRPAVNESRAPTIALVFRVDGEPAAARRALAAHAGVDEAALLSVRSAIYRVVSGAGVAVADAGVAISVADGEHFSTVTVRVAVARGTSATHYAALNRSLYSDAFAAEVEAIVEAPVVIVNVAFADKTSATSAPVPAAPDGVVRWNGRGGNWSDPSLWEGGAVANASEVLLCADHPNGTVYADNASTRANNVTLCNSAPGVPDTLVVRNDLCIGDGCP